MNKYLPGLLRLNFIQAALLAFFLALVANIGEAAVKPAPVFSDHMVLQRDMKVPIWGKAGPGEKVTVSFQGQTKETKADAKGGWTVFLDSMPANSVPAELNIKSQSSDLKLTDVLVGDVWVCSGQSNMDFPMSANGSSVKDAKEEIAGADYPLIRLLKIPRGNSLTPQDTFKADWQICSPQTVSPFSGVGYFFGRELFQKLNIPIGLINTSYGGTPVEAWMSAESMKTEAAAPSAARLEETIRNWPQIMEKYKADNEAWTKEDEAAKAAGTKYDQPKPRQPVGANHPYAPTGVYNSMLHPLVPYGIKGAIWYQGEGNSSRASEYTALFTTMIEQWRKEWNQGDFPFYFVQLANFKGNPEKPHDWAWLRDAQTRTLAVPNTGMALAVDLGDTNELHPRNKQDVGKRLALNALNKTYGKADIEFTGPVYAESKIDGNAIKVFFTHATGLSSKKNPLTGFEIAGEDKKFVPATAVIEGETVRVSAPDVNKPVAVRYAWINAPEACLYNAANLPAVPFRTDTWERQDPVSPQSAPADPTSP